MRSLQQEVNPLSEDTNFGINLYQQALQFLHNTLKLIISQVTFAQLQ